MFHASCITLYTLQIVYFNLKILLINNIPFGRYYVNKAERVSDAADMATQQHHVPHLALQQHVPRLASQQHDATSAVWQMWQCSNTLI